MELKTKVNAEDGKLEVVITREFELPVELLFRAHVEAGMAPAVMACEATSKSMARLVGSAIA